VKQLRYTLLSDGSFDRGLIPILSWLLRQHLPGTAIQSEWADLSRVRRSGQSLSHTIDVAIDLYPCDLLFVHRDAERASRAKRVAEIRKALEESAHPQSPVVCVVPVRMTEAWLLSDEGAIRRAAGNPNGRVHPALPEDVESSRDPKHLLHELLIDASELTGRRRKKFRAAVAARNVARHIRNFAPLRRLTAFAALESELRQLIQERDW